MGVYLVGFVVSLSSLSILSAGVAGDKAQGAQVLHLPHLHGAAPALAGTEQVGFGGRGGSWGGGRQEGKQPGAPGLGRVLRARGWDSLPSGVLATPAPTPPSPLLPSPAWTSSSAGSLTRNSWLRQLSGLSE